jgi:hypothetical protein
VQRPGQCLVLAQGGAPIAAQRVGADQRPLRYLVGRVIGDERPEQADGGLRIASGLAQCRQAGRQPAPPGPELVAAAQYPVLVPVFGQQVARVERQRRFQRTGISRSGRGRGRGVELLDVDADVLGRAELDPFLAHPQAAAARAAGTGEAPAGDVQRLVQVVQPGVGVTPGPQRLDDLVPVPAMAGRQRQKLDDVAGLAQPPRADRDDRAVEEQAEAAEQPDFNSGVVPRGSPRTLVPHTFTVAAAGVRHACGLRVRAFGARPGPLRGSAGRGTNVRRWRVAPRSGSPRRRPNRRCRRTRRPPSAVRGRRPPPSAMPPGPRHRSARRRSSCGRSRTAWPR